MEDFDSALQIALATFLGIERGQIKEKRANVGGAKSYGDVLGELKATFKLPPDLAARIWRTRYVNHFYAGDLARLRERWG
jgi:hypothetical protein